MAIAETQAASIAWKESWPGIFSDEIFKLKWWDMWRWCSRCFLMPPCNFPPKTWEWVLNRNYNFQGLWDFASCSKCQGFVLQLVFSSPVVCGWSLTAWQQLPAHSHSPEVCHCTPGWASPKAALQCSLVDHIIEKWGCYDVNNSADLGLCHK